jgi:antitoxin component HigA of HigAB toxin-antitoxin module
VKVLFLDIDGVVNKQENFNPTNNPGPYPLDSYCAFLVGKIQLETGCEVVLSSSWRLHPEGMENVSKRVVRLLDRTPSLPYPEPRGAEIAQWLDEHPEVTKYAIVDDDADMLVEQVDNFFKTDFNDGLTDLIADAIIKHLKGES